MSFRHLLLPLAVMANCYDGNNGGCSHFCSGAGTCSCPPCWTLDAAGQRCSIEAGKATVTCSSTGVTISIDKCAVPGVEASDIHLNDPSCAAVEDGETHWTIESSTVTGCGASASFGNDVFSFANVLHIGNSVVNNLVFGRNAAVDFVCNYNSQVSASSNFVSSNIVSSVSFDAGDVNDNAIDFLFTFSFYETADYQTTVDFATNPAAINAPVSIPDTAFVVQSCSVSDDAIVGSNANLVENNCPVDNGLGFTWGESTETEVKFEFMSFIFPESSDSAAMTLTCDINFCSTDDTDCLASCSSGGEPGDVSILVLGGANFPDSYIFSGDGLTRNSPSISVPRSDYVFGSAFAVMQGEMYIFGGIEDNHKIAKIENCAFNELSVRLRYRITDKSAAIDTDNGERALICFDVVGWDSCEIFDGVISTATHDPEVHHALGGLGHYNGQPTTVGGEYSPSNSRVETYSASGWTTLPSIPRGSYLHTLTGLESGALVKAGGRDLTTGGWSTDVWLLKNDAWTIIGSLNEFNYWGSAIKVGNFIYLVNGGATDADGLYPVERIEIANDEVIQTEVIGGHDFASSRYLPIFEVTANFCV
ncbi:Oidioi.mRNA.OKI2018_I69.chr1.g1505.t1.cds [Oikopleura dioica]|uniref:Oidioi.mRNA.OKI2018_I69.chr1.g1505.t1.cds n=1 Tax=Oikopleura dioica TaxID=34765 RepID=A0ABN7SRP0_OIKDI|nr:Oidioi.mRNA.OKI2018_I69.chr1.g1505.t1.cds [Oikopleura dioica]